MIEFQHVTVTYADADTATLRDVDLTIEEGELCLVVGPTGAGKSTLLGAVNGLVPHFTGGTLAGRVTVDGRDTSRYPPRELADVVGVVGQDPLAGFVTDTVEQELAYAMEQLAVPPDVMRKRVEETLDLLGLAELRSRALHQLSGGQQQRVAIGSVLTAHPRVLVLDEPTSALDPTAAEEVLAAITRLVHDLGVTVLLAEHRLERVVQYADSMIHLSGDGTAQYGQARELFAARSSAAVLSTGSGPRSFVARSSPVVLSTGSGPRSFVPRSSPVVMAPPIVELGRFAGWTPLPLSVRDARRAAGPLRADLTGRPIPPVREHATGGTSGGETQPKRPSIDGKRTAQRAMLAPLLRARGVVVRYGDVPAVSGIDLDLAAGEVTALMGRNGSGKSSLLWALQGSGPRQGGSVDVGGADPHTLSAARARRLVGLVPQTASDLLYLDTVRGELAQADAESAGASSPPARALLDRLAPGIADEMHPRDLSEGQRLALVLAVQLRAAPPVLLLDEPTRGLDYAAKGAITGIVDGLAADGRAVLISTHDVEFVAAAADRVVVMAQGEVVADGPTADVVASSPAFAPQVSKVLAPLPYLTVHQVREALQ